MCELWGEFTVLLLLLILLITIRRVILHVVQERKNSKATLHVEGPVPPAERKVEKFGKKRAAYASRIQRKMKMKSRIVSSGRCGSAGLLSS